MHIPKHFRQDDTESMRAFMLANPLGALITAGKRGLSATHIPFELTEAPPPYGSLSGHVARANPVWREISSDFESLIIFNGVNAYISPSWYPSKSDDGRVVPTWNYVVVHAYGHVRAVEERAWLRAHVERLTNRKESGADLPWSVSDAPAGYTERMLSAIVGIEIEITRLEGKWKLSQNRPEPDRAGVVAGLRNQGTPDAELMARYVDKAKG